MARITGTVRHIDIEGGVWVLESDDGSRYQLRGGASDLLRDGRRVVVDGEVVTDDFTIGMTGPTLIVRRHGDP